MTEDDFEKVGRGVSLGFALCSYQSHACILHVDFIQGKVRIP